EVQRRRGAAAVAASAPAVARAAARALEHPDWHGDRRRAIARELFYCPGGATARAVSCLYDMLSLAAPSAVREPCTHDTQASLDLTPALSGYEVRTTSHV